MSLGVVTSGMGSWSSGLGTLVSGFGTVTPGLQGADSDPSIPDATPSLWYGANWELLSNPLTETRSYQAQILNNSGYTWHTVAPLFGAIHNTPGQIIGWRVRNNSNATWTNGTINGTASYTFPAGTRSDTNRSAILSESATLAVPCPNGGAIIMEVVLAVGSHASGKQSVAGWPATMLTGRRGNAGMNSIAGDTVSWTSGFSQPWSHLYIGTDPAQGGIRKLLFGGDSLTANVNPVADSPNTRREGYSYVAWQLAVAAGEPWQIASFGRGTSTLAQMLAIQTVLAGILTRDHCDLFCAQGWSYNESPTSQISLDDRIASTQATLALWSAKGCETAVNFMSPAGSARNSPTYLPYYTGAVDYWTANQSVINLAASVADGVDPTIIAPAYSQDGIHINIAGAGVHGAAAYAQGKTVLQAKGLLA